MRFEFYVALRYLVSKRKQTMVPVISAISITGIAAGVAALILALALSTGSREEIQRKILGATSHINVLRSDGGSIYEYDRLLADLRSMEGILAATPSIYEQVFLSSGKRSHGAVLKGIDPKLEKQASELFGQIIEGSVEAIAEPVTDTAQPPGILLGKELGAALGVRVGDSLRAYSPKGPLSPLGPSPTLRTFKIVGLFSSGLWDYDLNWGYISIASAQKLFNLPAGSVSTIELRVRDIYGVTALADTIHRRIGSGFAVTDWIELNRPLFSALKLEKLAMFVTVCLIVMVAAFNIVTTLIMMVMEKNKDIAILAAMGVTQPMIVQVFMFEGLILGVLGTTIGCCVGTVAAYFLDHYRLIHLEPEIYSIPYVPFQVTLFDVVVVAASAILISFLATIYPARAASRLNPVEAMRYE